jgi:hypothetical protein
VSWNGGPGVTPFEHFHQFGNIVLQVGGGPVPEPTTLTGCGVGLAVLAGYGWWKSRRGTSLTPKPCGA